MKKLSKLPGVVRTSDCAIVEGANGIEGNSVCATARSTVRAAAPASPATAGSRQRCCGAPGVLRSVDSGVSVLTGRILRTPSCPEVPVSVRTLRPRACEEPVDLRSGYAPGESFV